MIADTYGPTTVRLQHPKSPDSDYPIIPPGGELEMDRSLKVGLVIFTTKQPPVEGWLSPGRYYLQPRFLTWEQTDSGAEDLARRRKSYEDLDDEEIVAEPMPIEIEMRQAMPDCRTR
jgi:hypothetical protein